MDGALKKVILVDDDAVVRIGLKTLVDWRQHGYLLVGEAGDAEQALALAQQHRPDIVITDMKMPGMDGIALIRALKQTDAPPYIIALSSYDDFPLVREAMKCGAADYMLKLELCPQALLQSLARAGTVSAAAGVREADQQVLQNQALHDLISRFYLNEAEMGARLRAAGVQFAGETVYCLLIKAGDLFRFEESTQEEYHTLVFSIRNIAAEIAGDYLNAYYADGKTGELYIFGALRQTMDGAAPDALVHDLAQRLRAMLAQYLDISCVIGIGKGENTASGMALACRQAAEAVQNRFYADGEGVLWGHLSAASSAEPSEEMQMSLYVLRQELTAALNTLQTEKVHAALGQARTAIGGKSLSKAMVFAVLAEIAGAVRDYFESCGMDGAQLLRPSHRDLAGLSRLQTTAEAVAWLDGMQADLDQYLEEERTRSGPVIVCRVEEILHKRYGGDISLAELAAELELTPGYISALMKKHTGLRFSEYLTRVRMEQAKRLLTETDARIYEIAAAVGYEDAFYFSRLFKRLTGVSPMDWRNIAAQRGGGT